MTGFVIGSDEAGAPVVVTNHRVPIHVLGIPGGGKSVLLGHLAEQAVAQGQGTLILDIKDGQLARDIVTRTRHTDKLIYVAPGLTFQRGHSWGVNVLDGPPSLMVDNVIDLFERVGGLNKQTTQLKRHLMYALWLARVDPDATLKTVTDVLTKPQTRSLLMNSPRFGDLGDTIRDFWIDFQVQSKAGGQTSSNQRTAVTSTLGQLDEFLMGDPLAALLKQPRSTLHLARWLDEGKLIVCNLVDGVPPRQVQLLGNVLMAMMVSAALARPTRPHNTYWRIIADEFDQLAANPFMT